MSLCEAEEFLRLARRFDRSDERLCCTTRRRPVGCELGRCGRSAPGQLFRELRMQLLSLAREEGCVDRLRQERVPEAEAARLLLGDEDAVLDRSA